MSPHTHPVESIHDGRHVAVVQVETHLVGGWGEEAIVIGGPGVWGVEGNVFVAVFGEKLGLERVWGGGGA
ncbi:hypothetical protein BC829DRAFT_399909 [Chytridium lagenaria]|nr:hypothetical protein BC829DRAFT_399909 [Chytridium lagenaria]